MRPTNDWIGKDYDERPFHRRQNMGHTGKMILTVMVIPVLTLSVNYFMFTTGYRSSLEVEMRARTASFLRLADEVKTKVSKQHEQAAFDVKSLGGGTPGFAW